MRPSSKIKKFDLHGYKAKDFLACPYCRAPVFKNSLNIFYSPIAAAKP